MFMYIFICVKGEIGFHLNRDLENDSGLLHIYDLKYPRMYLHKTLSLVCMLSLFYMVQKISRIVKIPSWAQRTLVRRVTKFPVDPIPLSGFYCRGLKNTFPQYSPYFWSKQNLYNQC